MVHRPGQKADVDHLPGWLTNNQRVLVGDCPMSTEINPEGLFLTHSVSNPAQMMLVRQTRLDMPRPDNGLRQHTDCGGCARLRRHRDGLHTLYGSMDDSGVQNKAPNERTIALDSGQCGFGAFACTAKLQR